MLLWGLVELSLAPERVPSSFRECSNPVPLSGASRMATAARNHTKTSPEGYAATHTQSRSRWLGSVCDAK